MSHENNFHVTSLGSNFEFSIFLPVTSFGMKFVCVCVSVFRSDARSWTKDFRRMPHQLSYGQRSSEFEQLPTRTGGQAPRNTQTQPLWLFCENKSAQCTMLQEWATSRKAADEIPHSGSCETRKRANTPLPPLHRNIRCRDRPADGAKLKRDHAGTSSVRQIVHPEPSHDHEARSYLLPHLAWFLLLLMQSSENGKD